MASRIDLYVRRFFAVAASLALISAPAKADEVLKRVYVLTEHLDDDAPKCSINADLVQSHAEKALLAKSVVISHNEHEDVVTGYVNVTVVRENDTYCAANINVQFYSSGEEEITGTNYVQFVKTVYCDKGTLLLGGTDRLPARVADAVEQYTGECVSQIAQRAMKRGPAS